jgi:hypothetical protein
MSRARASGATQACVNHSSTFDTLRRYAHMPRGVPRTRRWGILGGAIVGAALITGLIVLAGHRRAPVLEAKRVVVATFANESGDRSLDPLGVMAADWIARGLARTGLVDVAGTAAELRRARTEPRRAIFRHWQRRREQDC